MNSLSRQAVLVKAGGQLLALVVLLSALMPLQYAHSDGALSLLDQDGDPQEIYSGSYALLVGVHDYSNGWPDLDQIPDELLKAKEALELHGFQVELELKNTTAQNIRDRYRNFINKYGYNRENRLVFIYSGHGHTWVEGNQGYLVASDAPKPLSIDFPGEAFLQKALHISQMVEWSKQMTAKHALFLFDSCFSGTIFKTRSIDTALRPSFFSLKQAVRPVRQFITAGSADEVVPGKSVFMPVFIDAITTNKADSFSDGIITGNELGTYIENNVAQFSDQTPQFGYASYEFSQGRFLFSTDRIGSITEPVESLELDLPFVTENSVASADTEPAGQVPTSWPLWKKVGLGILGAVIVGAATRDGGGSEDTVDLTINLLEPAEQ